MNPSAPFVGLMSGTSMDAVDAVVAVFSDHAPPTLLARHSHPIPEHLQSRLRLLADPRAAATLDDLGIADVQTGKLFAEAALAVIAAAGLEPDQIDAIGSHGQTVRHRPDTDPPFTLQIGNGQRIAQRTGITTVADFRQRDMAAGGQGAPLAPAFHRAVFAGEDETRAVINIGGIANVTCLPAGGRGPVIGFDTGPGNTLLDHWTRRHRNEPFDRDGGWARGGRVHAPLLERLLSDSYLHAPYPKSTGPEYFSPTWLAQALAGLGDGVAPEDVQRTLLELTARHIADTVCGIMKPPARVLACGGGARNAFLMERLASLMPQMQVSDTGAFGIDPEWVEAAAFAWLARQALLGRPGNIREVTGANEDVVLGAICLGSRKWRVASGKE
jgi:anhydro-N-acetylmuramic acid kinase